MLSLEENVYVVYNVPVFYVVIKSLFNSHSIKNPVFSRMQCHQLCACVEIIVSFVYI